MCGFVLSWRFRPEAAISTGIAVAVFVAVIYPFTLLRKVKPVAELI